MLSVTYYNQIDRRCKAIVKNLMRERGKGVVGKVFKNEAPPGPTPSFF